MSTATRPKRRAKAPSEKTRRQALKILDRTAEVIRHEMMVPGSYHAEEPDREKAAKLRAKGAICNGERYCALGTLAISAGIRPAWHYDDQGYAVATLSDGRVRWREAITRLSAAEAYGAKHNLRVGLAETGFESSIEGLLEYNDVFEDPAEGRPILLTIVNSAKRRVRAA